MVISETERIEHMKKFISLLLVVAMCLSLISTTAFATNTEGVEEITNNTFASTTIDTNATDLNIAQLGDNAFVVKIPASLVTESETAPWYAFDITSDKTTELSATLYRISHFDAAEVGTLLAYLAQDSSPEYAKNIAFSSSKTGIVHSGLSGGTLKGHSGKIVDYQDHDFYIIFVLDDASKLTEDTTVTVTGMTEKWEFVEEQPEESACIVYDDGDGEWCIATGRTEAFTFSHTFTTPAADPVAQIGTGDDAKTFTTLADAVTAAQANDTITLLSDCSGDGIGINKSLTIDLNEKTYTVCGPTLAGSQGTKTQGFQLLKECGNITFKNGKIDTTAEANAKILIQNYANLTLDGVTLDGTNLTGSKYTSSNNNGTVVYKNGTKIIAAEGGVAFDAYYWPGGGYGNVSVSIADSTVEIDGVIEIDGETGYAEHATVTVPTGYVLYPVAEKRYVIKAESDYVARIGEGQTAQKFFTLADAIAAATDNVETEVDVIANIEYDTFNQGSYKHAAVAIPSTKKIVLDLNGHTISAVSDVNGATELLYNMGTLTIKDSGENGKITYISNHPDGSYGYGTNTILNRGILTIESGIIENTTSGGASYAVDSQTYWYDAIVPVEFTLTGGDLICTTGDAAIRQAAALGETYKYQNQIVKNYMTISGGKVTGDIWVQSLETDGVGSHSLLAINGGEITGKVYDTLSGDGSHLEYNVTGGYIGQIGRDNGAMSKEGFVSGGYFKKIVPAKLVADGYVCAALATTDPAYAKGYLYIVKPVEVIVKPAVVDEQSGNITVGGEEITVEGTGEQDQPTAQEAATAITETLNNPEVTGFSDTKIEEATPVNEKTTIQNVDDSNFNLSMILNEVKKEAAKQFDATVTNDGEITVKPTDAGEGEKFVDTDVTKQITVDLTAAAVTQTVAEATTITVTSMTFEVKPVANITVTDGEGETVTVTAIIPNDAITAPITFRLPVDNSVSETWAAVYHEGVFMGNYEIKTGTDGKYIEVSSMEFSKFSYVLVNSESAGAKIGEVPYQTFAEAVAAVQNDETIVLLKNNTESGAITVSREVTFTVNNGEYSNAATIAAGEGYKLTENDNSYSITKEETLPVGECVSTKTVKLEAGTFGLKLNGSDRGTFIFSKNGSGWNIQNSDEQYLAMKDGKLILSAEPFAWTYKNNAFSASVKTTQKSSGYWFGFIYIPSFGGSKTVTTTYYLSTVQNGEKLSTCCVSAELYTTVTGEHDFGNCWIDCKDGVNHMHVCKNCGKVETETHEYNNETHKCVCGAFDPDEVNVKISVVDVKEKTSKQYVGFFPFGYYKNVKTYNATIKTETSGVKIAKVQYQLNGSSKWITGTSVSSDKPIETPKVKAWDNNCKLYEYEWPLRLPE